MPSQPRQALTSTVVIPVAIDLGSAAHPAINYIDGDLTLSGLTTGYGILVVTGTLRFSGNFLWNGIILVVGDGVMEYAGGGNAEINGTCLRAKIWDELHDQKPAADPGLALVRLERWRRQRNLL